MEDRLQKKMSPRKLIILALLLAVLAGVFAATRLFELRRVPAWQAELERYLAMTNRSPSQVRIIAAVEAASPRNFSSDLLIAVPTDWTWQGIDEIPPPASVQCVRLENHLSRPESLAGLGGFEIVLVGFHDDGLWHAGWLVHEIHGFLSIQGLQDMLAQLGCDLGLDNLQALTGTIGPTGGLALAASNRRSLSM